MRHALSTEVNKVLENEIFKIYSVPETIISDNGSQFNSKNFKTLLEKYGINHMQTTKYSPQSNSSERVNRSIISAIRAYISDDHQNWDLYIPDIACALRNVVHASTSFSPHFVMFGQHMITHGHDYKILHKLSMANDRGVSVQSKTNRLNMCQEIILGHLKQAYERGAHSYNLRSKPRDLNVDQTVYVRNFVQSSASRKFSAKLAPKFVEAKIIRKIGTVAYELALKNGKNIGIFHAKDIRS